MPDMSKYHEEVQDFSRDYDRRRVATWARRNAGGLCTRPVYDLSFRDEMTFRALKYPGRQLDADRDYGVILKAMRS